jgi:5,10-methylenetetrahydromethanopterin reductase
VGEGRPLALVLRDLLPPAGPRELLPAAALVEAAALADRLGYDSVWVPEGRGRELGALLGAMAGATRRVGLATGILPVYSRPPALVAMMAATLADLSGGRFVLGIGAGHPAIVEDGYGVAYREPLRAAREFVAIARRALAGERVVWRGRVFRVASFQLESPPRHRVPIYLAALGPAMLRLAAETADGVILNWCTPDQAREAAAAVAAAAAAAGRDPGAVRVVCFVRAAVTDRPAAAWTVLRRLLATYAAMPAYARAFAAAGFGSEIAAAAAAWAAGGVEAAAAGLGEEFVTGLAAVGSAAECRARLAAYHEAGADLVCAYPFPDGGDAAASLRATIEGLAPGA